MAINKKTREAVYRKYGGRCAYCGRAIAYKDMQVDHFRPLRVWDEVDGAADDISNLMPACRMCNHYKRANSLEVFRRYIAEIPRKLRGDYIYKIGVAYGNVWRPGKAARAAHLINRPATTGMESAVCTFLTIGIFEEAKK